MCLIAHRDTIGAHIPNDVIDHNLRSNPDGFGIAWREPGKPIQYERFGPANPQGFRDLLKRIDKRSVEYAAHWRKATHGAACEQLSHPFEYRDASGNRMIAFHNGIINNIKTNGSLESDTSVYVNKVLARLPYGWWNNPAMLWLVEGSIGWSRFLIMSEKEDIILNEEDWIREGGINYSTRPLGYAATGKVVGTQKYPISTVSSSSTSKPKPWEPPAEWSPIDDDIIMADLVNSDEDEAASGYESFVKWSNRGHVVIPVSQIDSTSDEDVVGSAVCQTCHAEGDFFIIEGELIIEVTHEDMPQEDEDGDS